jgi:3-oxoacyl-[acyl-carrier-protein] synthase II
VGGRVPDAILTAWPGLRADDDRADPLAAIAIEEALDLAVRGVPPARAPGRLGLALGTALGASGALGRIVERGRGKGYGPESFQTLARRLLEEALAGAARRGAQMAQGPVSIFSVTCVSGLAALEQAAADLAFDRADAMIVAGADTLTPLMHGGFRALGALSPSGRLRPFEAGHDGIVIGEGCSAIVLEPLRAALARSGTPVAVVASQRLVSDALHMTSPDASGAGMARAIEGALADAGISPGDVGCITVTAAGSSVYDRMQGLAVEKSFGRASTEVPVTTWEPAVGHVLAATGVLGIAFAARVLERGTVPPVLAGGAGRPELDPQCRLRYVFDRPVPLASPWVLALTVGFGGQNGATVVGGAGVAADLAGEGGPA